MAKEESKQKKKLPTAEKREIRNSKKRLINKAFKSEVRTTVRNFESALKAQDKEATISALSSLYSHMDLGVKRGVFKANKAGRIKARAAAKAAALAS